MAQQVKNRLAAVTMKRGFKCATWPGIVKILNTSSFKKFLFRLIACMYGFEKNMAGVSTSHGGNKCPLNKHNPPLGFQTQQLVIGQYEKADNQKQPALV